MLIATVASAEELAVVEAPEPVPAAGQVLIDVDAIGAGYVDVMVRRGEYPLPTGPGTPPGTVPGAEVVGRVSAVGPGAPGALVGQRALAVLPAFGGYAEKVAVDEGALLPVPDAADPVDPAEVVALGVNALVADTVLHRARTAPGERVLVLGAGGGIGVLALQIARACGAEVTAVTSSAARGERLRALGADRVVDRTRSALPADAAYDVVVDPVAGTALEQHLGLLRPNGRYMLCGAAAGLPAPGAFGPLLANFHGSPTLSAVSLNSVAPQELSLSWKRVTASFGEGRLSPVIDRRLPLPEADAALRRLESGEAFGKVVLLPR